MNKTTIATISLIAILSTSTAYALDMDIFNVFEDYEVRSIQFDAVQNSTTSVVIIVLEKELDGPVKESIYKNVNPEDEKQILEFYQETETELEKQFPSEPEPEPTEAEQAGITEETQKLLDEKRIEQHGEDESKFERCLGGQDQAYAYQSEYDEVDLRKRLQEIEKKETLTTADWLTIKHCDAIDLVRQTANATHPGLVVREDTSPKSEAGNPEVLKKLSVGAALAAAAESDVATRYVTDQKISDAQSDAAKWICSQSHLKATFERDYPHLCPPEVPQGTEESEIVTTDTRTEAEQAREAKKLRDEKKQERILAWKEVCQKAWVNSAGEGKKSISHWRVPLIDGTCDPHIVDENGKSLVREAREKPENQKILAPKQNKDLCPDCKVFW